MVKRSREKSMVHPRRVNCSMMRPPYSAFHSQTRSRNSSRVMSRRRMPSFARSFSTTAWVAMPAWSVPVTHSAS